jgi:hypothetical protein
VVVVWVALFWTHVLNEGTTFLPSWFTSNAFDFPLNTVTTLAELYIGFLVAAATNRAERYLVGLIEEIRKVVGAVYEDEETDRTTLVLFVANWLKTLSSRSRRKRSRRVWPNSHVKCTRCSCVSARAVDAVRHQERERSILRVRTRGHETDSGLTPPRASALR